jgi:mycofactocin glycosyltransferase
MCGVQPFVSVVVAALDAEGTIGSCLDSLVAQRYPRDRLELVVVDNGSRDRTCETVARYAPEVVLVHEARRGIAVARNAGIAGSRGDVIALIDADCTADPGWVAALVDPLAHPTAGIVGGSIRARRPATRIELFGEAIHDHHRAIVRTKPPYVITMNWAARRAVIDQVGGFDESFRRGSDVDFSYRVARAGYDLVFCPHAIIYHCNERSLAGLVREGWTHGLHGAAVRRRHRQFIARSGDRVEGSAGGARPSRLPAMLRIVFRLSTRLGAAAGRLRLASARRVAGRDDA